MLQMLDVHSHALKKIPASGFALEEAVAILIEIRTVRGPARRRAFIAPEFALLTTPGQFETILAGSALRILDSHHSGPSIARHAHQLLPPPAVDLPETNAGGVGRHRTRAIELTELR